MTLETDQYTITCEVATIGGTIDGNTPATGTLDFTWDDCDIVGGTSCSIDHMNDVSIDIGESAAPDATIVTTSRGETFISCGLVFHCTMSTDPADGTEVEIEVAGGADPVLTINDTLKYEGAGCADEIQWVAQYEITEPEDGLESDGG